MLVRLLVIVDDGELDRRLDRILEPLDAAVATAPSNAVLWDRVKAFPVVDDYGERLETLDQSSWSRTTPLDIDGC